MASVLCYSDSPRGMDSCASSSIVSVPAHVVGGDGAGRFHRQQGIFARLAQVDKGEAACSLAGRGAEEQEPKIRSPMLGETRSYAVRPIVFIVGQLAATESKLPFASTFYGAWSAEYMAATLGTANSWRLSCRPGSLAWIGSLGPLRGGKVATRYIELCW